MDFAERDFILVLSIFLSRHRHIREALLLMESAAILCPSDAKVFRQLGYIRLKSRDYKGSIDAFNHWLKLAPKESMTKEIKLLQGKALLECGRKEQAEKLIKQYMDEVV